MHDSLAETIVSLQEVVDLLDRVEGRNIVWYDRIFQSIAVSLDAIADRCSWNNDLRLARCRALYCSLDKLFDLLPVSFR